MKKAIVKILASTAIATTALSAATFFASSIASAEQIITVSEKAHLDALNAERIKASVSTLQMSEALTAAAKIRAEEIVTKFDHTRPDSTEFSSAIENYSSDFMSWGGVGENIAKGDRTVSAVIKGWMDSEKHRENMLHSDYKYCGLACFESGGTLYWVQLFSKSKPSSDTIHEPSDGKAQFGDIKDIEPVSYPDSSIVNSYPIKNLMTDASVGHLNDVLVPRSENTKISLIIFTYGYCNYTKNFLQELNNSTNLGNLDDLDIVLYSYDVSANVVKWLDENAPNVKTWNNIKFVKGSYFLLADAVNKSYNSNSYYQGDGSYTPFIVLLEDNKIISFSDSHQANLTTYWANKIDYVLTGGPSFPSLDDDNDNNDSTNNAPLPQQNAGASAISAMSQSGDINEILSYNKITLDSKNVQSGTKAISETSFADENSVTNLKQTAQKLFAPLALRNDFSLKELNFMRKLLLLLYA